MQNAGYDHLYQLLDTPSEREFDDVVRLASRLCGAPTALVTLLDDDRQWFKARVNFPLAETDLERSVCRHVVDAEDTLVFPDLTADDRTSANPLVTGDPAIRFYAGAPIITREGAVGAVCVIDTVPRPEGLSAQQLEDLASLARQVEAVLEARRDAIELKRTLAERDAADAARKAIEGRWEDLYKNMDQGFIYAHALRDEQGRIHDWRYVDVNRAWSELTGIPAEQARGETIRDLIPGIEEDWIGELADVVDTHQPVHFTRQVGVFDRWYDGTSQWVGDDHFTILFSEVTDRVNAEHRRDALLTLGDTLRDCETVETMVQEAARIVGETLGASRTAYGEMDAERMVVDVAKGWSRDGMPAIEGAHTFESYGRTREDLAAGRALIIDDVDVDPRTADMLEQWQALKVRGAAVVPVLDRGRPVAILMTHFPEPHRWSTDEVAFLRNAADRLEIGIARVRAEARQALLNGELSHRMKNTLSVVQAIASQTLGSLDEVAVAGFGGRLIALSSAHDVLLRRDWSAAAFGDVAGAVLSTFATDGRIGLEGPTIEIGARATLSLSLLLHELATNAAKYGALSVPGGRVTFRWSVAGSGDAATVSAEWVERGGPPAIEPQRRGFGSRIIRLGLIGSGGVTLAYEEAGLTAAMTAPLHQMREA